MTDVRLPDGRIARFPDDMSQEQIQQVLQRQFGAPKTVDAPPPIPDVVTPQQMSPMDAIGGALGSAFEGVTFGQGGELRGLSAAARGLADVPFGDTQLSDIPDIYRAERERVDAEREKFADINPVTSGVLEGVGGLASTALGTLATAGTAPMMAVANTLRSANPLVRTAASIPVGAGLGLGGGLVQGVGKAEEIEDIPGEMLERGVEGAKYGAIFGPAAEIATAGLRRVPGLLGLVGDTEKYAGRRVQRALAGADPEAMARAQEPMGMLADVNQRTRSLLENVTKAPGEAEDIALPRLLRRSEQQSSLITNLIGEGQIDEAFDVLRTTQEELATPLYRKAFDFGVEHTDELEGLFNQINRYSPNIWARAKREGAFRLANQGYTPQQISNALRGDTRPTLEGWQQVKETVDGMIERRLGANDRKGAGQLIEWKKRLLDQLDAQSPEYKAARKVWAGTEDAKRILTESADKFMNMKSRDWKNFTKDMDKNQRNIAQIGVVQAIEDTMERAGYTHDITKRFRTPAMERKIRDIFPKDEAEKLFKRIETARDQQSTFQRIQGGSRTFQLQQAEKEGAAGLLGTAADIAETAASVGTGIPTPNMLRKISDFMTRVAPGRREAARRQIAEVLTLPPELQEQALTQLFQAASRPLAPPPAAPLLPAAAGGLLAPVAGNAGLLPNE